jgi:hypothetical protein
VRIFLPRINKLRYLSLATTAVTIHLCGPIGSRVMIPVSLLIAYRGLWLIKGYEFNVPQTTSLSLIVLTHLYWIGHDLKVRS